MSKSRGPLSPRLARDDGGLSTDEGSSSRGVRRQSGILTSGDISPGPPQQPTGRPGVFWCLYVGLPVLVMRARALSPASCSDGSVLNLRLPIPLRALLLLEVVDHRAHEIPEVVPVGDDVVQGISSTPEDALHSPSICLGLQRKSRRRRRQKLDGCPARSSMRLLARATHDEREGVVVQAGPISKS